MPWVDVSDNDPGRVDLAIRAAIHTCWHAHGQEHQSLEVVEGRFRRLVDRAFRNLKEDAQLFVRTVIDGAIPGDDDGTWPG